MAAQLAQGMKAAILQTGLAHPNQSLPDGHPRFQSILRRLKLQKIGAANPLSAQQRCSVLEELRLVYWQLVPGVLAREDTKLS